MKKSKILIYIGIFILVIIALVLFIKISPRPSKKVEFATEKNYKISLVYGLDSESISGEYDSSSRVLRLDGEDGSRSIKENIYALFIQHLNDVDIDKKDKVEVPFSSKDFRVLFKRLHIWNAFTPMVCDYEIEGDVVPSISCYNDNQGTFMHVYFEF